MIPIAEEIARELAQSFHSIPQFNAHGQRLPLLGYEARVESIANTISRHINSLAVCDCHTWPTVKEMHEYVVTLEEQYREMLNKVSR
jgi:hypothetical protein